MNKHLKAAVSVGTAAVIIFASFMLAFWGAMSLEHAGHPVWGAILMFAYGVVFLASIVGFTSWVWEKDNR